MSDPTALVAVADILIDPRVKPLVDALTDAQVTHVLRQMNAAWCPENDAELLISTPDANRSLVFATITANIAYAARPGVASTPEKEFATFAGFVAAAHHTIPVHPITPEPAEPTTSVLWHLAMELLVGSDMQPDAALALRRIGSPPALRLADHIDAGGDMARVELQATRWFVAGLMSYGLLSDADCAARATQHELASDLDAATIRMMRAELPRTLRLPHWQDAAIGDRDVAVARLQTIADAARDHLPEAA